MATISTGTVKSHYSRHSGKRHLVSAIVRVPRSGSLNSGVDYNTTQTLIILEFHSVHTLDFTLDV